MNNQDISNELKNMKDKLRDFTYVLNRIIKELEKDKQDQLNKSTKNFNKEKAN